MMLELEDLTHWYDSERAVDDVSLDIESGELVALLGPSGCGKTTLVQLIAGHLRPTSGRVALRGVDVTDDPPESRAVSVVFQQPTLYPHMTAGENVAYGLAARDVPADRRDSLVAEYLELVALQEQRGAYPAELSGGQKRRVELARALAPQPDLLVLDEPLSALDRSLRERLREEIARIQRETGVTTLFVTHDQEEAMAIADRLVVMRDGGVAAVGSPRELYESPPSPFVASFLGRTNTFEIPVLSTEPLIVELLGEQVSFPLPTGGLESRPVPEAGSSPARLTCYFRPSDVSVRTSQPTGNGLVVEGETTRVIDAGCRYDLTVETESNDRVLVEHRGKPPAVGETVSIGISLERLLVFDSNVEP